MIHHSNPHSVSGGRRWQGGRDNSTRFSFSCLIGGANLGVSGYGLERFLIIFLLFSPLTMASSRHAWGGASGPPRQSTQLQPGAGQDGSHDTDVYVLKPGQPARRELMGGRQHTYQVELGADQFLKVTVEQQGIDLVIRGLGPDGKQILEVDSEIRLRGPESVSWVAAAAGTYQLVVHPKQRRAAAGNYEIRIEELRGATEQDRALDEARNLSGEYLRLQRAGKYDEALVLAERARTILEKVSGTDRRDLAVVLDVLANLHREKGEMEKAEPLYRQALEIMEQTRGSEHPDVARILSDFAVLCLNSGEYERAESLQQRALAIRERALGPDHLSVAASLNNLANVHFSRREYEKAELLHQRALAIREKELGPEHQDVAASLENLALIYGDQGDFVRAESLYQRALPIWEKTLGPDHPELAQSLNNIALFYYNKGDYVKAEPLYRRALAIWEKILGPGHPNLAVVYNNMAMLYDGRGDYLRAKTLYQRALTVWEKALGPNHPYVSRALNNLAILHSRRGDYAKAEPLYQRALAVAKKALGPENLEVTLPLFNLANIYYYRGEYGKAESLYQRVLAIREKVLRPEHPDFVESLNSLAVLYATKGNPAQAVAFQSRANLAGERSLALNLAAGSERQKLAYLALLSKQVDQTISIHLHHAPADRVAANLAATMILQRKGRVLDATSEILNTLRSRFGPDDQLLLDRLSQTRTQIAGLTLDGPQNLTPEQYRKQIQMLEERAEDDEASISRHSSEFRAQSLSVTLEAVQAAIPADATLIEFASYRPLNARASNESEAYGQPRYVAYVLGHQGEIRWKDLGAAPLIDRDIAALRGALRNRRRRDVKTLARILDQKIFQPIRPLIGDPTQLLISPDGPLNLIPFAALVDEQGRYLVERYSISYLTSGRDLLRLQVARVSQNDPVVFADPDFGEPDAGKGAPPGSQAEADSAGSARPVKSVFSQLYFSPLPYTAEEGEALRALLPDATLLTGRQATKTALLQIRSPRLLHIATHSFFLGGLSLISPDTRGYQFGDDPTRILQQLERKGIRVESPLLRSGVALAGANERQEEDNGLLTALEVTGLNLWGTKLVVLSACDTGIGEVKNGDGVYGLRRALVLAGSETQVISLWAVSDKATRELMVAYYRELKQERGRSEALRQVQLEMLKDVKRRHPYYWASFISSGEWGNLEGKR